jgi:hypothetical protein
VRDEEAAPDPPPARRGALLPAQRNTLGVATKTTNNLDGLRTSDLAFLFACVTNTNHCTNSPTTNKFNKFVFVFVLFYIQMHWI